MYLRSTPRRNKDGSEVRYLQLAHNVWDPQLRRSKVQVVYNFGREDATNRDALQRLVASITRFLDPAAALAAAAEGLEFTESRPLGGTWALDAVWSQLGIGPVLRKLLKGRRLDDSAERVLFALVANRALAPSSKLAAARWISDDVLIPGLPATSDGIPVRVWCWPGNTSDSALIRQVKDDMRDWCLARVIWVADRGFTSAENRRYLRKGGGSYIIGEKLRSGSAEAAAALSRQGRYKDVAGNLKVKEVRISDDERFVICFNPEAAERDAAVRAKMIARLEETIRDSDQLSRDKRAELRGVISTRPGLNRYLRVTPGGLLRTDAAKAKAEENLDGKYLLRTADPKLSAEDIAAGYKQLLEVERGWRDMKQVTDLRP